MSAVLLKKLDRIATITINRQEKQNALNGEAIELLHSYLDDAQNDEAIRVIVITGAGSTAFCSGADLSGVKDLRIVLAENKKYAELLSKLSNSNKTTISVVNGICLGGGMGLMLSCDLSLTHSEVLFGTPEINIGLFPLMISPLIYQNVKSDKIANDLIMTGRKIKSNEAFDIGLISKIFPKESFENEVENYISNVATKSSQVMNFGKESIKKALTLKKEDAFIEMSKALGELMQKEDAREGITAFLEKRKPNFKY